MKIVNGNQEGNILRGCKNKFMKAIKIQVAIASFLVLTTHFLFAQVKPEPGDPANNEIPRFFKSTFKDVEEVVSKIAPDKVSVIAESPGGHLVYAVTYGEKEDFYSQTNYNSAVAAQNPAFYAQKGKSTKPVVYLIGPVHGHEVENIAGLLNLIQVVETGKDFRGKSWTDLNFYFDKCRVVILPCPNPDGRVRCPYNSFVGLPVEIMTKYGQGTRKDGSLYGWPGAKEIHPMVGDVGILGAYFNDDGVNIMQDEFFSPMAEETRAIMELAIIEAPDMTVSLHSHNNQPLVMQPSFVPLFMKERVYEFGKVLNEQYGASGLPQWPESKAWLPSVDDKDFPPRKTFNLISALHHACGTMAFTFECPHGALSKRYRESMVGYEEILDIQLILFEEMFKYILNNRLYWEK